jgi:DnaK suppressor protein
VAKKSTPAKTKAKPSTKGASKPSAKKPVAKPAAKKPAPKPVPKPAPKKVEPVKAVAKKPEAKKPEVKKPEAKATPKPVAKVPVKAPAKLTAKPAATKPEPVKPAVPAPATDDKSGRKGITIVSPKPMKKPKPKAPSTDISALAGSLLSSGLARKPLIASGPNAPAQRPLGAQGVEEAPQKMTGKSPFTKEKLDHFRAILVRKRAELLGDVSHLEEEALRGESGALSNMPQHMAEQGSETYEQSLHLDLAAAGSKLIKEIDDAIRRIDAGTFGICELTGKPIRAERLEELPWARYSIEAARELERRSMRA